MNTIRWTEEAAGDLEEIAVVIAEDAPTAASDFVDSVDKAVGQLASHPLSGRVVPELLRHNVRRYREVVLSPWRLFYVADVGCVTILAIIDGRRNIEDILLRRVTRPGPLH